MKKIKWWLIGLLVAAVLFLPVPVGFYKDGGTREFQALTYKLGLEQTDGKRRHL